MTSKHSSFSKISNVGIFDGLNCFSDLEARISKLASTKEIGDAFEIFAEAYLATQKITQAKEVWPFEAVPLEQRKALSLDTGRDMGVDGTYLTTDGELRAYQVKFRSRRAALTWDDLSTFMGLTDQVSQRVLFTNSETLPDLMRDRSGFVAIRGSDLDRLTAEDFEAMRQWLHSGQAKQPHEQPMPHQQEALSAIAQGLAGNDRATVVMACGTGKSLVSLWAAERQAATKLLVLVPSLALVRQLLHEWLRETALEQFTFMCVCSDPTVAKGADDVIVHQADLDFPVTTDSAVVGRFLAKPFNGTKIVFSTYQSAHVVAEGMPKDERFGELSVYKAAYGDTNVPTTPKTALVSWISNQRTNAKSGTIPLARQQRLTEIGFVWDALELQWEARFSELLAYKAERGGTDVPQRWPTGLGVWINRQRQDERKGDLSDVRKTRLNEIGFLWNPIDVRWESRYDELRIFISPHKYADVPNSWPTGLGKWIAVQRKSNKNGTLASGMKERLDEIGFSWEVLDSQWEEKFQELLAYRHEHGDLDVPQRWPSGLGAWLNTQRKAKKNGVLPSEREARLTDIGAVWDPLQFKWDCMFAELLAFKAAHGHANVPINGTTDLDAWVGRQRKAKSSGQLSEERIASLNEVGFDWDPFESQWEEGFSMLLAYRYEHDHVNVPQRPISQLGRWVRGQREAVTNGRLTPEHQTRLNEIGFMWVCK